jgi:hypothetical protein
VAQVALSLVALVGAGLFVRSLRNADGIDPGFDAGRLGIVSFTIRDIRDTQGYLDALGKPRIAQVKRDAIIAQARAAHAERRRCRHSQREHGADQIHGAHGPILSC